MLKLKILQGPTAGTEIELKPGESTIGRQSDCDIVLASNGVSKRHAKITVFNNQCVVTDLGSSNGTFVNGVKIQNRSAKVGDRIGFHDVLVEVIDSIPASTNRVLVPPSNMGLPPLNSGAGGLPAPNQAPLPPKSLGGLVSAYVDNVVLPGVYKINQHYPTKGVVAGFMAAFVILVTILATIPMAQMTEQGVRKEGRRRALSLTRQLADFMERAFQAGTEAQIRTDFIESEEGVDSVLVVARDDGHIIAPLSKAQGYSSDEFVARARKSNEVLVQEINSNLIGVSVPIEKFSPETGRQEIAAYAVVQYKLNAVDLSATAGLFARVLVIAFILGGILFFFMYRVVVNPLADLSQQLDGALRGENDSLKLNFDFPEIAKFVENINAALSRMSTPDATQNVASIDRGPEASNLVRIVNDPAFALDAASNFLQVNAAFEELTGQRLLSLQGLPLTTLSDQALQLNLEDLVSKSRHQPGTIVSSQLDIHGHEYEIDMQSTLEGSEIAYFFGTIKRRLTE